MSISFSSERPHSSTDRKSRKHEFIWSDFYSKKAGIFVVLLICICFDDLEMVQADLTCDRFCWKPQSTNKVMAPDGHLVCFMQSIGHQLLNEPSTLGSNFIKENTLWFFSSGQWAGLWWEDGWFSDDPSISSDKWSQIQPSGLNLC